jgi:anti-anti-sigma factor
VFETPLSMEWDGVVLRIGGSVDEYSISELRERLADLVANHRSLKVDVSDVEFLPSAGIGILARARAAARDSGGVLDLVARAGSPAQRILDITGIPHLTSDEPGSVASD